MVTLQSARWYSSFIGGWFEMYLGDSQVPEEEVIQKLDHCIEKSLDLKLRAYLRAYKGYLLE